MPKIIVTSRYIKPNAHKKFGNYIKYIATREGVEKPMPKLKANRELDREIFDAKTVSELLGHSNVNITLNRYVHSSMETKKKCVDRLNLVA